MKTKRPLDEVRKRIGKHAFSLLSDAPKGRLWCHIPTSRCVDEDEMLRAIDEYENPKLIADYHMIADYQI